MRKKWFILFVFIVLSSISAAGLVLAILNVKYYGIDKQEMPIVLLFVSFVFWTLRSIVYYYIDIQGYD